MVKYAPLYDNRSSTCEQFRKCVNQRYRSILLVTIILISAICLIFVKSSLGVISIVSFLYFFVKVLHLVINFSEDFSSSNDKPVTLECFLSTNWLILVIFLLFTIATCLTYGNLTSIQSLIEFLSVISILSCIDILFLSKKDIPIGAWLAMLYYHGFLKFAIPKGPDSHMPGMYSRMEEYENIHHSLKFRCKKFFILVPKSCEMSNDLTEFNKDDTCFQSLGDNSDLLSAEYDRNGVQRRQYKCSVYKIIDNDRKVEASYFVGESPTPLKTLCETINDRNFEFIMNRNTLARARTDFVRTLIDIFQKYPEIGMYCDIIEFDDTIDRRRIKLSDIVLNRIKEIEANDLPESVLKFDNQFL